MIPNSPAGPMADDLLEEMLSNGASSLDVRACEGCNRSQHTDYMRKCAGCGCWSCIGCATWIEGDDDAWFDCKDCATPTPNEALSDEARSGDAFHV